MFLCGVFCNHHVLVGPGVFINTGAFSGGVRELSLGGLDALAHGNLALLLREREARFDGVGISSSNIKLNEMIERQIEC